jgi:hypothetical protein
VVKPINKIIIPILGWKKSHDIESAKMNSGMQMISAARKIAKPTIPEISPPTKGMYPRMVVIGEKNRQIPMTIAT